MSDDAGKRLRRKEREALANLGIYHSALGVECGQLATTGDELTRHQRTARLLGLADEFEQIAATDFDTSRTLRWLAYLGSDDAEISVELGPAAAPFSTPRRRKRAFTNLVGYLGGIACQALALKFTVLDAALSLPGGILLSLTDPRAFLDGSAISHGTMIGIAIVCRVVGVYVPAAHDALFNASTVLLASSSLPRLFRRQLPT